MDLKFADIPNGLAAIGKVPVAGWAQILAYMAFCEISQKQIPGTPAYDGDFGWKVITSDDPEIKKKKLNSEIANGRLAMMGIIGLFFQDGLTGSPWGYWAGNPSSFWKAFENELGVQAPFGFWDPIGFTADGDVDAFKRRRATELKHGRIAASSESTLSAFVRFGAVRRRQHAGICFSCRAQAMLATMGFMTPEQLRPQWWQVLVPS